MTSQNRLRELNASLASDPKKIKMYIYDIVSPNYQHVWLHANKRQYIEARPWMLSLVSAYVLRPQYQKDVLLHVPSQCPIPLSENTEYNTKIVSALKDRVYYEDYHSIARVNANTYYEYFETSEGEFVKSEITYMGGDGLMIACFCVSFAIGIYGAFLALLITIKYRKWLNEWFAKWLIKKRKLQKSKKELSQQGDEEEKGTTSKSE